jgi:hypothetical protein
MRQVKLEWVAGGAAIAALMAGFLAAFRYRNYQRIYERGFNPDTIEEISGTIQEILFSGRENSDEQGMELLVESGDELEKVHAGPVWFLDKQGKPIKKGDKITVRGSRINYQHEPVLIAEHIQRNSRILKLRDNRGHPLWEAWTTSN